MSIYGLLVESRVDEVRRKYPNLSADQVNDLIFMDPTDTKKYLLWLARESGKIFKSESIFKPETVKQLLIDWTNNINRFRFDMIPDLKIHYPIDGQPTETNYKDIYIYSLGDVRDIVSYLTNIPTKKEVNQLVKSETKKIFEGSMDGYNILVVQPLSYQSSCHYGATTRWCTASKTTKHNFETYTKKGDLFYVIFKDETNAESQLPVFKYAIYFQDSSDPQIYNEEDHMVNTDDFFTRYPGLRKLFKHKLPITFYEGLLLIHDKKYKDDFELKRIIKQLDDLDNGEDDITFETNIEDFKNNKMKIYIGEDTVLKMFVGDEDRHTASNALNPNSYNQNYQSDLSSASETFDNGYVFYHFQEHSWDLLLKYFKLCDTNASMIVRQIIKTTDNDKKRKLYQKLADVLKRAKHEELRDEITTEFSQAEEDAINVGANEEIRTELNHSIKQFFQSICKDEVVVTGIETIVVSLDDVLRWYQKGDERLPEGSPRANRTLQSLLVKKDHDYVLHDVYEFYYSGDMDDDTFTDKFNVDSIIERYTDRLESDPEIMEQMEFIDQEEEKLRSVNVYMGHAYKDPSERYSIVVADADLESGRFRTVIKDRETKKVKRIYLTADRIINLLKMKPLVDVIDEIYNIFAKITS